MKKYLLIPFLFLFISVGSAQTKPKQKPPAKSEMDRAMEEAMKGMSEEEKAEMKKMMKEVLPEIEKKPGADIVSFSDNRKLVPAKDAKRISTIPQKLFTDADISSNTALLYNKLMGRIPASEKAIITKVIAGASNGADLMEAAVIALMQGHQHASMGLAIKAVQAEPKNVSHQSNLAAILTQSGYPEKAIPFLKKLSKQFPDNSTVLHNLGFAWLSLGQVDTARRLFAYAAVRNPNNPETKLCRGVIEELRGDPRKASEYYVESFEDAPNPFTENMAKNVKAEGQLEKIDFEKLKSRIIIYEYFKKDWIQIPTLQDNVSTYENDISIKNGYSSMFHMLDSTVESLINESNAEMEALIESGESEFAKAMLKESMKGLSMMSMPAVYVQKILINHIATWTEDYLKKHSELLETIKARKRVMTTAGTNDKCPDMDRKNDAFLAYANPLIRKFHAEKIEEARVWLNAYCTWTWYIAGNPKNSVLTQCISMTAFIIAMYESAIADQYVIEKSCVQQDDDGITFIPLPSIPNFTCPAVVTIPIGLDELRLSSEAINFDNNGWNIKQAEGAAIPNITLALGVDRNGITEPGKYGNPYVKTGNGSINASGINYAESNDAELMPLSKILDDLTPLSTLPLDELTPLDPSLLNSKKLNRNDIKKIRNAETTRKLLKEMMKVRCPGELPPKKGRKLKFDVDLESLVLDDYWDEEKESWINSKGEEVKKMEIEVGELTQLEAWDEEMQAYVNAKGEYVFKDGFTVGTGKLELEDLKTSGLQIVINNGLEAAGSIKNFIKGLFE